MFLIKYMFRSFEVELPGRNACKSIRGFGVSEQWSKTGKIKNLRATCWSQTRNQTGVSCKVSSWSTHGCSRKTGEPECARCWSASVPRRSKCMGQKHLGTSNTQCTGVQTTGETTMGADMRGLERAGAQDGVVDRNAQ
ncbi:hypothetical protein KFK09_024812 [Dendrobium nobile]|uniref:Uncharacterized protein n=1 Tax=Dendrobium nobile TaxID=94219 RepID=A0A8T3AES6_DENNO|nr:hypothetical protein KFK09_024812 [Dendrobium nobile]